MAATPIQPVTETREGQGDEPTLEELQARVFDRGRSLASAASALRGEMRKAADWRTHAARHPYWALGAAAVVGVLSASLLRRRRDPQARMIQAAAQGLEVLAGRLRGQGGASSRRVGRVSLLRGVVGALATRVLRSRLERRLQALGVPERGRGRA